MLENRQIALIEGRCHWFRNSSDWLKTHCAANDWPIWTQKVPKEALDLWTTSFYKSFFKNILLYVTVGCQKYVWYIRMLCPGWVILVESVFDVVYQTCSLDRIEKRNNTIHHAQELRKKRAVLTAQNENGCNLIKQLDDAMIRFVNFRLENIGLDASLMLA